MDKKLVEAVIETTIKHCGLSVDELFTLKPTNITDAHVKTQQDAVMFILFRKNIANVHEISFLFNSTPEEVLCRLFRVGLRPSNAEDKDFYQQLEIILNDLGMDSIWR